MRGAGFPLGSRDLAIACRRTGETEGERPIADQSLPVASPRLLAAVGHGSPEDVDAVPAIRAAAGDRDWTPWAAQVGLDAARLDIRHAFDSKDEALHAAVARPGMVLAPTMLIERETQAGTLVPLAGFEAVELGTHRLMTRDGDRHVVRRFTRRLRAEIARFTL